MIGLRLIEGIQSGATAPTAAWAIEYIQSSYKVITSSRGRVYAESTLAYQAPDDPPSLPNTNFLYGAWWARQATITNSAGNAGVTAWAPYQAGDGLSPPTLVNSNATYYAQFATTNASFNTKPTVTLFSNTMLTANAPYTDFNYSSGFITMALYLNQIGTNGATKFEPHTVNEAGNSLLSYFAISEGTVYPHMQWTGSSPSDQNTNAVLTANSQEQRQTQ